jgi:hypothetical protein
VDERRVVVGLALYGKLLPRERVDNEVILMVGGLGSRLGPHEACPEAAAAGRRQADPRDHHRQPTDAGVPPLPPRRQLQGGAHRAPLRQRRPLGRRDQLRAGVAAARHLRCDRPGHAAAGRAVPGDERRHPRQDPVHGPARLPPKPRWRGDDGGARVQRPDPLRRDPPRRPQGLRPGGEADRAILRQRRHLRARSEVPRADPARYALRHDDAAQRHARARHGCVQLPVEGYWLDVGRVADFQQAHADFEEHWHDDESDA